VDLLLPSTVPTPQTECVRGISANAPVALEVCQGQQTRFTSALSIKCRGVSGRLMHARTCMSLPDYDRERQRGTEPSTAISPFAVDLLLPSTVPTPQTE